MTTTFIPAKDEPQRPFIERGDGRPKKYVTSDGRRAVGVTTLTGRFADKTALIRWAYNRGVEGKELYEQSDLAKMIGSSVHEGVEEYLYSGKLPKFIDLPDDDSLEGGSPRQRAKNGFEGFKRWFDNAGIRVTHLEIPIANDDYAVAGTLDAMGVRDGKRVLLDWKTSGGVYADYLVQVRAYGWLWESKYWEPVEQYEIVRFSKESSSFEHRSYTAQAMDRFGVKKFWLRSIEMYRLEADIKKLMK